LFLRQPHLNIPRHFHQEKVSRQQLKVSKEWGSLLDV
jgi:hypothetical protein